jgi:predicted DNA-binding WGR domain protein
MFTRWGRVGEDGQMGIKGPVSAAEAEKGFCTLFKQKTGNNWDDRHRFVKKNDKYELIMTRTQQQSAPVARIVPDGKKSSLPIPTQEFLQMILDKDMFKSAMADLKLDMNALAKLPLGVLDSAQVARGLAILNQIEKSLTAKKKGANISID